MIEISLTSPKSIPQLSTKNLSQELTYNAFTLQNNQNGSPSLISDLGKQVLLNDDLSLSNARKRAFSEEYPSKQTIKVLRTSCNTPQMTIMDLPKDVWEHIAERCHFEAVLSLLQVCKGNKKLKEFVSNELDKSLINHTEFGRLNSVKFNQILEKHAFFVTRLTVSFDFEISKELNKIILKCFNLEQLEIREFPTNWMWKELENMPKKIKEVSVAGPTEIPDWFLGKFAKTLKKLMLYTYFYDCDEVDQYCGEFPFLKVSLVEGKLLIKNYKKL
jgi:hypothetical protein